MTTGTQRRADPHCEVPAPGRGRQAQETGAAPAPRQTSPAARIRRSAAGWASASARNPAISARL
jgi:hypothetical protein